MAPKTTLLLILGCGLLGGYASMFTAYKHGFFDALRLCTSMSQECILDMSESITNTITGYEQIDGLVNLLIEFFSQGLRRKPGAKGVDLEALLAFVYLATQFGGAWYIMALEGLRRGNRGTILSWYVFFLICQ